MPSSAAGKPSFDLAVEITTADGTTYRWDSNSKAESIPLALAFRTKRGTGFADASLVLARPIDRDYSDLNLLDDITIFGADGSIAYEGRIAAMPRTLGGASQSNAAMAITVQAVGWMAHTQDRMFQEIYVDRDLSAWVGPSFTRQANLLNGGYRPNDWAISVSPDESIPAVTLASSRISGTNTVGEVFYISPVPIGFVYYDLDSFDKGSTSKKLEHAGGWSAQIGTATDDTLATVQTTGDLLAGGATLTNFKQYFGTTDSSQKVAYFQILNSSFAGGDGQWNGFLRYAAVYGKHGVTTRNPVDGTNDPDGFYASDVITNIISRFAPKLNTSGIQATTYPIPHLAFKDPITPFDAVQYINGFHLWDMGVWEDKTFTYGPTDLSDYDWEVRLDDFGVSVDLQGDSTDQLANGIIVTYTDVQTLRPNTLYPTDHAELQDTSISNPLNTHGIQKWTTLNVSTPTTQTAALQIGAIALAEFNQAKAPGTIRLSGHIRDRAGHWQPAWKVRAGDTIAITNHPDDRPRLVVETQWDSEQKLLTVSTDNTMQRLDAILDRINTALHGNNLI